jgi:hypothetical protein
LCSGGGVLLLLLLVVVCVYVVCVCVCVVAWGNKLTHARSPYAYPSYIYTTHATPCEVVEARRNISKLPLRINNFERWF